MLCRLLLLRYRTDPSVVGGKRKVPPFVMFLTQKTDFCVIINCLMGAFTVLRSEYSVHFTVIRCEAYSYQAM